MCKRQVLFTLSLQLSHLSIAQTRSNKRRMKNKMTWEEYNKFMKKFYEISKLFRTSRFLYMWHTPLRGKKKIELLWTSTTTLHTKPKQKFISSVMSMWPTRGHEKNKTLFGPPQLPSKLNQNKSVPLSVLSMWLTHVSE